MGEIPTFAMSGDDLDGIEALTEACKPWNPLREASEALIGEVRRLRAAVMGAAGLLDAARERDRLRAALRDLVDLKDGPRGADYERRKPSAWEAARRALAPVADPDPHTTSDEEA
jgi:hypothetical protein